GMQCKAQIAPRGHSHASNLQRGSAPAGGNPTGQFPPRKAYSNDNEKIDIRLIDHRIVGHDWLTQPATGWQPPAPARIVFASLKGGVGRSTALAVLATELARQGRKVLAIDLDLEAPGIGTMLIDEEKKPKFGVLDWYVERGVGSVGMDDREFLLDMIAPSPFGRGKGLIDVAPAVGSASDAYPANVLAKIARAYLELSQENEQPLGFLQQTQVLIDQLSSLKHYDAILIDARAGLNESTAAALLGLGADVLLFGVDTPQTFASYRYLLAHLARFKRDEDDDWLYRLRMVHAKASADETRQAAFRDRAYAIFSEFLYRDRVLYAEDGSPLLDRETGKPITTEEFGLNDATGPHYAWPILASSNFTEFDPLAENSLLTKPLYEQTFTGLIGGVDELLGVQRGAHE
ncbi:MAG: AAA family ATPase, partial [Sulfuricellaceae bacterium]